jgi:phosphohistidine swiveling domain-containing protein
MARTIGGAGARRQSLSDGKAGGNCYSSSMSSFADLRLGDQDGQAGLAGKARSLVRLALQNLPTPRGFAVTGEVFAALCPEAPMLARLDEGALALLDRLRERLLRAPWPAGFVDELRARLAAVGAPSFAVRSSFAGEDAAGQLAAGIYESYRDVPEAGVEDAIRKVFASAVAPGAVAYALARGARPAAPPLFVLVHEFLPGQAEGSAAFASAGMREPLVTTRRGGLDDADHAELARALATLSSEDGPTEIEWVKHEGRLVYLQARPYQPPAPPKPWSGYADLPEAERDPSLWHWDAAHNPLPLSAAQAGLVAFVDEHCHLGFRQRALGGYLFYTRHGAWAPPALPTDMAEEFFSSLGNAVGTRLAHLSAVPTLEDALSVFLFAYEPIFGMLQPALRKAHENLRAFLAKQVPAALVQLPILRAGVASMASQRAELARAMAVSASAEEARARYLATFGDEAPIWDVSAATYAEQPEALAVHASVDGAPALDWQRASAEVEAALEPSLRESWRQALQASRTAVALGEADDWLYARAQAAVRRALLGLGRRLVEQGRLERVDAIFDVPLAVSREVARGAAADCDLAALAEQGRKSQLAAKDDPPPPSPAVDVAALRGAGTGGRAMGRVRHHRPGERTDADAVLVAPTLLPTELPLIEARAIVTDTGGPLDHVAAQARERRIPAVVGAHAASVVLRDGDLVLVDGDAGLVVRLGSWVPE